MEDHLVTRGNQKSTCDACERRFSSFNRLWVHQRTSPHCLTVAGRCYYFEYCKFESDDLTELRKHMTSSGDLHVEYLTLKVDEVKGRVSTTRRNAKGVKSERVMENQCSWLQKMAAELYVNLKLLEDKHACSESSGNRMAELMKQAGISSTKAEGTFKEIKKIETRLGKKDDITPHLQNLNRNKQPLSKFTFLMDRLLTLSNEGEFIWKINHYAGRKRAEAIGRPPFHISSDFFSSRFGYKMCMTVYLNGIAKSNELHLSLFFVLLRGDYDEILEFPYNLKMTLSLLCPTDASLSKHKVLTPLPDCPAYHRPVTDQNIAAGFPNFATQEEIEPTFVVDDCIYIRILIDSASNDRYAHLDPK